MSSLASSALTGNYAPTGEPAGATHAVAHAFGYRAGENGERLPGPTNEDLARHLCALAWDGKWVVQEEIWDAVPPEVKIGRYALGADTLVIHQSLPETPDTSRPAWERDVKRAAMPEGKYLSSEDIWKLATRQAEEWGIAEQRPLVIAHSFHVGRVAAQGRARGMDPIVPPGLSSGLVQTKLYTELNGSFDPKSAQPWTRSRARWAARELLAIPKLIWFPRIRKTLFRGKSESLELLPEANS